MTRCASSELHWALLGPEDLDRIVALHAQAIRGMSPDQVRPERPEFFAALLEGAGRIVGACDPAGDLVAYGVLQDGPDPGTRPDLWLDWPEDARIQKLAGSSVAEAYRGLRLQRTLIRRRIELADPDAYLYATAAPSNPASWRSLLHEGFEIRRLRRVYQDSLRYLMARRARMADASAAGRDAAAARPLDELLLDEQDRLLSRGWRGRLLAQAGCVLVPPEGTGP
ncbi:hypothetical protein ABRZ04_02145 [Castellaniella ginsengisoli]|uniref:N-acetyltransferase domain-containing protein n=1 Tax=Castellaniella ginsengisoli TaxID=546114 RepID=A0AB39D0S5_9BURK